MPTVVNVTTKPVATNPLMMVNQVQNNSKTPNETNKANTDQINNKNMGLSNSKDE